VEVQLGCPSTGNQERCLEMDASSFIVPAIIVAIIALGVIASRAKKLRRAQMITALSPAGFQVTQIVLGADGLAGISFDERTARICIAAAGKDRILRHRVIAAADIMSGEIFEDGESITRTDRSSQIAGAAVGALVLGGAGLLIGGLSGKTRSSTKTRRIELRIVVNNTTHPTHDVAFFDGETDKNSDAYKRTMENARRWLGIVNILIHRSNDTHRNQSATSNVASGSIADELQKLAVLLEKGILDQQEFQQQKTKLLCRAQ